MYRKGREDSEQCNILHPMFSIDKRNMVSWLEKRRTLHKCSECYKEVMKWYK